MTALGDHAPTQLRSSELNQARTCNLCKPTGRSGRTISGAIPVSARTSAEPHTDQVFALDAFDLDLAVAIVELQDLHRRAIELGPRGVAVRGAVSRARVEAQLSWFEDDFIDRDRAHGLRTRANSEDFDVGSDVLTARISLDPAVGQPRRSDDVQPWPRHVGNARRQIDSHLLPSAAAVLIEQTCMTNLAIDRHFNPCTALRFRPEVDYQRPAASRIPLHRKRTPAVAVGNSGACLGQRRVRCARLVLHLGCDRRGANSAKHDPRHPVSAPTWRARRFRSRRSFRSRRNLGSRRSFGSLGRLGSGRTIAVPARRRRTSLRWRLHACRGWNNDALLTGRCRFRNDLGSGRLRTRVGR